MVLVGSETVVQAALFFCDRNPTSAESCIVVGASIPLQAYDQAVPQVLRLQRLDFQV